MKLGRRLAHARQHAHRRTRAPFLALWVGALVVVPALALLAGPRDADVLSHEAFIDLSAEGPTRVLDALVTNRKDTTVITGRYRRRNGRLVRYEVTYSGPDAVETVKYLLNHSIPTKVSGENPHIPNEILVPPGMKGRTEGDVALPP